MRGPTRRTQRRSPARSALLRRFARRGRRLARSGEPFHRGEVRDSSAEPKERRELRRELLDCGGAAVRSPQSSASNQRELVLAERDGRVLGAETE